MTKRSLKGTNITTRAGLTRDSYSSIWQADTSPDSAKDNPLAFTVLQDAIAANIKAVIDGGVVQLTDSTNDCVAFAPSSVIDVTGSVYEVLSSFYIYCSGNVFKVNTGSATLTDTIRLIVSSTEDGLFQTADIDDGGTVVAFEGTTAGDGIINYADIRWLGSTFSVDIENGEIDLGANIIPLTNNTHDLGSASNQFKDLYIDGKAFIDQFGEGFIPDTDNSYGIGSASNAWADIHAYDMNADEYYDKAGTAAPTFPEGVKSSKAVILPESDGEAIYIAEFFESLADNVTEDLFTFTKTANNSGNGTQVIIAGSLTLVGYTTEDTSGRYVQTLTRIPIMIAFRSNTSAVLTTGTAETIQNTANLNTAFTLSLSTANTTTAVLAVTINVSGGSNGNLPTEAPYMAILDIGQAGGGTFNSLCTVTKSGT